MFVEQKFKIMQNKMKNKIYYCDISMKKYEVITLYGVSQFKLDSEISRKMSLVEKNIWCWPCHDVKSRPFSWITVSLVFLNEYSNLYSGSRLCRFFDSAACFPNIWFAVKLSYYAVTTLLWQLKINHFFYLKIC